MWRRIETSKYREGIKEKWVNKFLSDWCGCVKNDTKNQRKKC